ncbi:MAG: hypothetical protein WCE79_29370 [Xanthobacteraceae bacterium]
MRMTGPIAAAALIFALAASVTTAHALCTSRPSMTGVWNSNDGGKYFVRQRGSKVWWVGVSGDNGKTFINVFRGDRNKTIVTGTWADVVGTGRGTLTLKVNDDVKAGGWERIDGSGFGGSRWSFPCEDVILNPG